MNFFEPRDQYCERLGPGLFAEPANALSNLAFIAAAILLWRLLDRRYGGGAPWTLRGLAALIFLIGLGSGAYHTFAVVWAEILDVLFIALFIHFFIACFFYHRLAWPWWAAALAMPGFYLFGLLVTTPFDSSAFNGSVSYFPTLFGIGLMALYLGATRQASAKYFFAATAMFFTSLLFRTFDATWCDAFPLGTHWIWHTLNAGTLLLVTLGLIDRAAVPVRRRN